jgi:hypothetical protein
VTSTDETLTDSRDGGRYTHVRSEHRRTKPEYRWLVAALALPAIIGGLMLLPALARHFEKRAWRAHRQEQDRQFRFVRQKLEGFRQLDEAERAKAVWDLWLYVTDKHWEGGPKTTGEPWSTVRRVKRELLQPELESLGDNALEVLVEEIRNPSGKHPFTSLHAHEAAELLYMFGERAVYALAEILKTGSQEARSTALNALRKCVAVLELTDEARQAIAEAVTPLLDSPHESLRESAEILLEDVRD